MNTPTKPSDETLAAVKGFLRDSKLVDNLTFKEWATTKEAINFLTWSSQTEEGRQWYEAERKQAGIEV